jgi:hypothetical protein
VAAEAWPAREARSASGLAVFAKSDDDFPFAEALLEIAGGAGIRVRRLAVRRADPHLTLYADLPGAPTPAAPFFGALRAVGERVTKP